MSTITAEQQQSIAAFLTNRHIPQGLGTQEEACSIAAINLALRGELTDSIPDCMSMVIGRWIIVAQDSMPDSMRNSERWRKLLPRAAGTGRARETARLALIMDWMWSTVLPVLQSFAHGHGFGSEWLSMCKERTPAAAVSAANAAENAAGDAAWAAGDAAENAAWEADADAAAWGARAAARAADAAGDAAENAADAADADAAAWGAGAAWAAARAADAVRAPCAGRATNATWENFDPCGLLEKLIELPEERA